MHRLLASTCLLATCGLATAQWSNDSDVNTPVDDGGTSPAVTHSASDGDGGAWVAWYDASSGYDVMLQHLDATGVSTFDEPVLVDDQTNSSVQDFELTADALGRAVLAWPGDSSIEVACVNIDGSIAWTNEFGDSGAFLGQAQLAPLPAGFMALAWAEDDRSVIQRITVTGAAYGSAVVLDIGGTLIPADLQPSGGGSFIASFVQYESFTGPKRLKAQKYNSSMAAIWGLAPIDIFTTGSLQFGNYPEFVPDTQGGGVFSWYDTGGSSLMARMQWVDSDGTILMGTNGMAVTTDTSMVHVGPRVCIDPLSNEATVFWVRQNSSQSSSGIQANRIDMAGSRLWGQAGVSVMPLALFTGCLDLHAVQIGTLATGSWIIDPSVGDNRIAGAGLDATGASAWPVTPITISNASGTKTDLTACPGDQMLVTCWVDDRDGADGLHAQNANDSGTLGIDAACPGDINDDGQVGVDDLLAVIAAWQNPYTVDDLLLVIAQWDSCD